jgi:hypothetical protein
MAKRKMVKTALDKRIAELAAQADHKTLAVWACDCVERVLPYFEEQFPEDERPTDSSLVNGTVGWLGSVFVTRHEV